MMASDQLFIGIDSGTQGTKAVVLSRARKKILAQAFFGYDLIENSRGGREQDPAVWVDALEKVILKVLASPDVDAGKIKAIGISGQQHGMVPLDSQGNVIRPAKLWCDTETEPQCETLTRVLGGEKKVIHCIGNTIAVGFTASKILWLKEHEPENYDRMAAVLLPHDYLNYRLTGELTTEPGDASGTAYYDVVNRTWSKDVLLAIDGTGKLEKCLPQLVESRDPAGTLLPVMAEKFGLSKDVIVSSGGGDNMMAAIGTGNIESGIVTASLGTSGTIYAYSDRPIIDPEGEVAAFSSSSGGWLPLVCTMNVTVATERVRSLFSSDLATFNQMVAAARPGSDGIILLPYLNGERTPALPSATGSFHGLTSLNLTRENLSRAAMEGVTFGLLYAQNALKRCGICPDQIRLTGGGSKSPVWRQMVSDILGCPVVLPEEPECGALGGALQALWCHENRVGTTVSLKEITQEFVSMDDDKRCDPDPSTASVYRECYETYLFLSRKMASIAG